jgi:hypothetical protein
VKDDEGASSENFLSVEFVGKFPKEIVIAVPKPTITTAPTLNSTAQQVELKNPSNRNISGKIS